MSLDTLIKMLKDLSYYGDCEITHTLQQHGKPIISVSYLNKEENSQIMHSYQIKYIESQKIEIYNDVETAALAIDGINNSEVQESH
jgi:uncharacterized protein YkuJ